MSLFDLNGKVAFVTGGNGGIGLGMAKGMAEAGANVVIAARNKDKADAAIADPGGGKDGVMPVRVGAQRKDRRPHLHRIRIEAPAQAKRPPPERGRQKQPDEAEIDAEQDDNGQFRRHANAPRATPRAV